MATQPIRFPLLTALAVAFAMPAMAQTPPPQTSPPSQERRQELPAPVPPAPVPPPSLPSPVNPPPVVPEPTPVDPPPPAPAQPSPSVPPAPQQTEAEGPGRTLAGKPGSSDNVDELELPDRTAVVTSGETTWEKATETLNAAHARLNAAIAGTPAKVAGKPLALFVETDANGFKFEAMVPVTGLPEGTALPDGVTVGKPPTGKALRFVHKGPYAEIDNTYEAITAYLDGKGYTVKDQFLEEYLVNPKDENDPDLEVNIYVQPR